MTKGRSGFADFLFQQLIHLTDDGAPLTGIVCLALRVSLEVRPHLVRHVHELEVKVVAQLPSDQLQTLV